MPPPPPPLLPSTEYQFYNGWLYCLQGAASGMRSKVALFLEVRDNFSEGLRFYMSLQEAISHLAQQVGDYSMTRQIQRWVTCFPH